jgi:hypothetical protein
MIFLWLRPLNAESMLCPLQSRIPGINNRNQQQLDTDRHDKNSKAPFQSRRRDERAGG